MRRPLGIRPRKSADEPAEERDDSKRHDAEREREQVRRDRQEEPEEGLPAVLALRRGDLEVDRVAPGVPVKPGNGLATR